MQNNPYFAFNPAQKTIDLIAKSFNLKELTKIIL